MRTYRVALILLFWLSQAAWAAQLPGPESRRGAFFLFGAPVVLIADGEAEAGLHLGFGGEYRFWRGLGLGADLGYLFDAGDIGSGVGFFSPGLMYQFRPSARTVPFLQGGYTLAFASGVAHGVHFGGGVTRWWRDSWGLRFEVRDHFPPEYSSLHILEFRVALLKR